MGICFLVYFKTQPFIEPQSGIHPQDLQANPGRAAKLQRMANLLLVSAAQGGIIAVDLTDPRQPAIISAGNLEAIEAVDVFVNSP